MVRRFHKFVFVEMPLFSEIKTSRNLKTNCLETKDNREMLVLGTDYRLPNLDRKKILRFYSINNQGILVKGSLH